jgi:hypothetical protein
MDRIFLRLDTRGLETDDWELCFLSVAPLLDNHMLNTKY